MGEFKMPLQGIARRWPLACAVAMFLLVPARATAEVDYGGCLELFQTGEYAGCLDSLEKALREGVYDQKWRLLKIRAEMAQGLYPEASETLQAALRRHPSSIELRLIGHEVYLYNGQPAAAAQLLDNIERLARQAPWRYSDRQSRLTLGRFMLRRGADARQVLEVFFDPVRKQNPEYAEAYVASGQLALEKDDFRLAADFFRGALKIDDDDPDFAWLLARALASDEAAAAADAALAALSRNPNHVESLLFQVDHQIDSEQYAVAQTTLDRVLQINPEHAQAWAYLAVLAHLRNEPEREQFCRRVALGWWENNPEVDHLIGRKLSEKYRFAEGAEYQQQALKMDAGYLPARIQLCQDLLRLGREEEGWGLADEVFVRDQYNVLTHNLLNLRDRLVTFRTLEDRQENGGGLIVRMDAVEADVYGQRVMRLLRRARDALCEKYDVQLREPVVVEIFPRQADFAIRTFGLPGGQGFLGVCFGRVITANSPASQGENPANWEAVLWHEFCHVVTLQKTKNKMPRWLSEGISVYEERQQNAAWGQSMNPRYRQMVLQGQLTPVSQLSGAFLAPKSAIHLQFAYYESSLVVEYLVERYGVEMLQRVLVDLSVGMPINDSLVRYTDSLEQLDQDFAAFARQRAEKLGNEVDWSEEALPETEDQDELAKWVKEHPRHFVGQLQYAHILIAREEWEAAVPVLKRLLELYPNYIESDNAYRLLAEAYQELKQPKEERKVLEELVVRDADAHDAGLRLLEIDAASQDWPLVRRHAECVLAINPLIAAPHRRLAEAATHLEDHELAAQAYRAILALGPQNLAETHHQLARSLIKTGNWSDARRQTLLALEDAPRFRQAHRTLLEIIAHEDAAPQDPPPKDPPPKDTPPKDTPPKDTPPKDTPLKDAPLKDAPPEDAPPEDAAKKEIQE